MANWRVWLVNNHLFIFYVITLESPSPHSQYGSSYTESAYEEVPFAEPAEEVGDIYDQLAQEKCIEMPRVVLK